MTVTWARRGEVWLIELIDACRRRQHFLVDLTSSRPQTQHYKTYE